MYFSKSKLAGAVALLTSVVAVNSVYLPEAQAAGSLERVSLDSKGIEGNATSSNLRLSLDGRMMVFQSDATNLVTGDTNTQTDVFFRDKLKPKVERISVDSAGVEANDKSMNATVSNDGRYVVYESMANNLVTGDGNAKIDIFMRDRKLAKTLRLSVTADGTEANDDSTLASISADGRFIVFKSSANNLVAGDDNGVSDIFIKNLKTGVVEMVSLDSTGASANGASDTPVISSDGRYVAFASDASNLSLDDSNEVTDIFIRDMLLKTTERVSLNSNGAQAKAASLAPSVSADGRFVAFHSGSSNLVARDSNAKSDIFVRDRELGTTERVSISANLAEPNGASSNAKLSADGRFVVYRSLATNLISKDTNRLADIFVTDRETRKTERININTTNIQQIFGVPGLFTDISAEGRLVAFDSNSSNLVLGDRNRVSDVFVRNRNAVNTQVDLSLTHAPLETPVARGDTMFFIINITNKGPAKATDVILTDQIPFNAELLTVTPSQGECTTSPVSICRLGDLEVNDTVTVEVALTASKSGTVINTAWVSSAQSETATTDNLAAARLSVQKTVTPPPAEDPPAAQ